jgi:hypothetical protein
MEAGNQQGMHLITHPRSRKLVLKRADQRSPRGRFTSHDASQMVTRKTMLAQLYSWLIVLAVMWKYLAAISGMELKAKATAYWRAAMNEYTMRM